MRPTDLDAEALAAEILRQLQAQASAENLAGMARYGISEVGTLGVSMPVVRRFAAELRPLRRKHPELAHDLAGRLWSSGIHEARILASLVDIPALVSAEQADAWLADFDSWDTCDQVVRLFVTTPFAYERAARWSRAEPEFIRRAGLVMVVALAVHDKAAEDARICALLDLAIAQAADERNFVKKAVNWALRQAGKRSASCHRAAVAACDRILLEFPQSGAARWSARGALRELHSEAVVKRLGLSEG